MHVWFINERPHRRIAAILAVMIALPAVAQLRYHVKPDTPGGNDGLDWSTAFESLAECLAEIEDTVEAPPGGWEVWVVAGVHRPARVESAVSSSTFPLPNLVQLYGGFAGTETELHERVLGANETILEGLFEEVPTEGCGDPESGSCVEVHSTPGCADPGCCNLLCGAWPSCCTSAWDEICVDVALVECGEDGILEYRAEHVVSVTGTERDRSLDGVTVINGYAGGGPGGGLYIEEGGVDVASCYFRDNRADAGGAIGWLNGGAPAFELVQIVNSRFADNHAEKAGGAIFAKGEYTIATSLFYRNGSFETSGSTEATEEGGAISDNAPTTAVPRVIVNCTIVNNVAGGQGGGVFVKFESEGDGLEIVNSIIWGNTGTGGSEQIGGTPALVRYSNIEGGYAGSFNLDVDPAFVDGGTDDYRLDEGSQVIDRGDNNADALIVADLLDIDGDDNTTEEAFDFALGGRVRRGSPAVCVPTVDMGAFELQGFCAIGDFDEDGTVDGGDLGVLLGAWGTCTQSPCLADLNCDGEVDGADLGMFLGEWGIPRECGGESFSLFSGPIEGGGPLSSAELADLLGCTSSASLAARLVSLPFEEMVEWLELLQ